MTGPMTETAKLEALIVAELFADLRDRRFLKWLFSENPTLIGTFTHDNGELRSLDGDVQQEIRSDWEAIISRILSSLSPTTGGWKGLESAPLKRTIVVGRHDWDNVTTVNWANELSKADDLANWSGPPTHWLDGVTLPSPPEAGHE